MTLRVQFPHELHVGGTRVFEVHADGSETELHEVAAVEIMSRPDDVVRIKVETFLHAPASIVGEGVVVTLCPHCAKEVECSEG